ncbi:MAG: 2-hydroxyacid dehydrogenase, partial [Spirochaetota bacterium]
MKETKIAFFDAKPYDIESFDRANSGYGFTIKYFPIHLNAETSQFAKGYDAVCAFVNDTLSQDVIGSLHSDGVKMVAMR